MDINNRMATVAIYFNTSWQYFKGLSHGSWLFKLFIVTAAAYLLIEHFNRAEQIEMESVIYINSPKINDIYFLDFRLLSNALRPNEKYRLAKVVDITGDVVTLRYGNMFYLRQKSLKDGIQYGQLRYRKYFEPKRYDFSFEQIRNMWRSNAIYLVKRPVLDRLYGSYVSPEKVRYNSNLFIPGKRENISASSLLKSNYIENNLSQAFELLQQSAQLGYAEGQVNLAQMYLNGQHVEKDRQQALFWFKQSALQSNKSGILKYVIVCKQVILCNLTDFYQELLNAGVNIKVRTMEVKLSPTTL